MSSTTPRVDAGSGSRTSLSITGGDVFTQTNSSSGNAVLRYHRQSNGHLTFVGSFATGGKGAGTAILAPTLGPSHSVQLTPNQTLLFVTDAGTNDIASFAVSSTSLQLIGRFSSRGGGPVSLAVSNTALYVLDAKANNVAGFSIDATGALRSLGSTQSLSGASGTDGPVDLRIANGVLVATEKFANIIDTFTLTNGRPNSAVSHTPHGETPFGMAVRSDGLVADTEAFNDTPGASAVTTYRVSSGGSLTTISGSIPDGQTASCWAAFTPDQADLYTTNTASSTISEYAVGSTGTLTLLHGVAASEAAGSAPTDVAFSSGAFLYNINQGAHTLTAYSRNTDGTLTLIQTVTGLPSSDIGIAVR